VNWRLEAELDTNGTIIIQLLSVQFLIYLRVYSTGQRLVIIIIIIIIMRRRRRRRKKKDEEEKEATET
jgi:hypothetical protein